MRFKIAGVLLIVAGAYLVAAAIVGAEQQHNDALSVQVQPLAAIFLVLLARVLQAEKHHRDLMKKATEEAGEKLADSDQQVLQPIL